MPVGFDGGTCLGELGLNGTAVAPQNLRPPHVTTLPSESLQQIVAKDSIEEQLSVQLPPNNVEGQISGDNDDPEGYVEVIPLIPPIINGLQNVSVLSIKYILRESLYICKVKKTSRYFKLCLQPVLYQIGALIANHPPGS